MEDYKEETKKAYNKYPEVFEKIFGEGYFNLGYEIKRRADFFIKELKGKKIVDLGAGPGHHAEYFKSKGFDVLCIDISEEMVRLCKENGLRAEVMDVENLKLPEKSFDGVWEYTCLLHLPKNKVKNVINAIIKTLKPNGVLGLTFIEGSGEGFQERDYLPWTRRWFAFYTDEEIKNLVSERFEILSKMENTAESRTRLGKNPTFLTYILRLK